MGAIIGVFEKVPLLVVDDKPNLSSAIHVMSPQSMHCEKRKTIKRNPQSPQVGEVGGGVGGRSFENSSLLYHIVGHKRQGERPLPITFHE